MIRPFTCVCMLLAAGSGLYLYQTKHTAQMLDREIIRTAKAAEAVRERTGMLKAEWALLQEPERLTELSSQHLGLKALDPKQFVAMADLPARLPAPLPPGTVVTPALDVPMATDEPAKTPLIPQTKIAATKPLIAAPTPLPTTPPKLAVAKTDTPAFAPKSPPPLQLADATPLPPKIPPAPTAASPALVPAPKVAAAKPAPPAPAPAPALTPAPRIMAPIVSVSAAPMTALPPHAAPRVQGLTAPAHPLSIGDSVAETTRNTVPRTTPPHLSAAIDTGTEPVLTSALGGMRSTLPPPVPYGTH